MYGSNIIEPNAFAQNEILLNCNRFILNAANPETFHPYLQVNNINNGLIEIITKDKSIKKCIFNIDTNYCSNKLIKNYFWNKQHPQTWLTKPIAILYNNNKIKYIPYIFKYKYLYPFELNK